MSDKTILVTGASGFTGLHFIAAARTRGYRCVALCQHPSELVPGADECKVANLLDMDSLSAVINQVKPSLIVHLAAVSFVAHEDAAEIYQVNLIGTLNLLSALARHSMCLKKILIASSANIYGNSANLPIAESTRPQPANHYGVSKYAMEMAAAQFTDLPIVLTRPFNYTGIGQNENFLIPKIVNAYKQKQTSIQLGNLDVSRDFSDVRDVVNAYLELLELESSAPVYNICSGVSTSLLSIIDTLNEMAGYRMSVTINPDFVRANEIKELYGSCQLLQQSIGDFRKHDIRETLQWMYRS
jgi:nucleoside-diphosphate-sugar epimerase